MKRIYITLFTLLIAMMAMVYLYFSKLTAADTTNDISLYTATAHSGLIFCVRNDKSVSDILSGQDKLQRLLGPERSGQLSALKNEILSNSSINNLIAGNKIYISFMPGENRENDYLVSTQLNAEESKITLLNTLNANSIRIDSTSTGLKLTLKDSTIFYLGIKDNLVVLSDHNKPVLDALNLSLNPQSREFAAYIKSDSKFSKNSLANLYADFNRFPLLLKTFMPGGLNGELAVFSKQHAYAALSYNFSKERLFFIGSAKINDNSNYLSLFSALTPQKNIIDNILPDNTANFTLYAIPDYPSWHKSLNSWFVVNRKSDGIKKIINNTNQKYRLDLEAVFPKYFKQQLISFQLKTSEKLGAIQLDNGDKVSQLLLDLSENYSPGIKLLKEPDLLYCYFGEPFKKFSKPYYTIIDNYMVFSNYASSVQAFLNSYQKGNLLINTPRYSNLYNQISDNSTVTFYINPQNSADLVRNTVYTRFYKHFKATAGLGEFSAFIYQLSGNKEGFQTNLLINTVSKSTDSTGTVPQPAL